MEAKNEDVYQNTELKGDHPKTVDHVVLVPQPSDDPKDPLNWPLSKKIFTLSILAFAGCMALAQQLANQSGFFPQAALYHKAPVEMSYGTSGSIAGTIVGPLIWAPSSQYVGRSSLILWGMLATFACNVWSASMTNENQYISFIMSRMFAGFFCSTVFTLGSGILFDIFFLHQRGKAFAFYSVVTLFGALLAPVVSGFITERTSWPIQFWWCVGALGFVFFLVFFFLEDTTYDRQAPVIEEPKQSYVANRIATFFPGNKIVKGPRTSPWTVFAIALCPPVLVGGVALIFTFGWVVGLNATLAVFLQTPVEFGGYGFSPQQNAEFTFSQWISFLTAELYGLFLNDRVALWICRRRGGVWKPEYRLFPLLIPPLVVLPVGLIIFGVGLQYHLHYMVLATGLYLATFADMAVVPILNNYVAECFTNYVVETYTALWCYRIFLGLAVPFFIIEWVQRNGPAWAFGVMAILSSVGGGLLCLLAWKGEAIRKYSPQRFVSTEEGAKLVESPQESQVDISV